MKATKPRVLLIGEDSQGYSHLVKRLEGYGCKCRFATSYQEAISLFSVEDYDLVLSPMRLCGSSVFPLVNRLEGSGVTLFYFQAVEEGCWWLPALRWGRKCFGSCALRPSEFVASIELVIDEIQAGAPPAPKSLVSAPPTSAIALPWPATKPAVGMPQRTEHRELVRHKAAG
jgi:hypothetical protein